MGMELPAGGAAVQVKQRWSAKEKAEVVLRLLRGEDIESVSREVKVPAFVLSRWREEFLEAGTEGLRKKPRTETEKALRAAQAGEGCLRGAGGRPFQLLRQAAGQGGCEWLAETFQGGRGTRGGAGGSGERGHRLKPVLRRGPSEGVGAAPAGERDLLLGRAARRDHHPRGTKPPVGHRRHPCGDGGGRLGMGPCVRGTGWPNGSFGSSRSRSCGHADSGPWQRPGRLFWSLSSVYRSPKEVYAAFLAARGAAA